MENKRGKKGLSPVIATVLLIAMVFVLASIIFMWARGFITEQIEKFEQPIENVCGQVDFVVDFNSGTGDLDIVNHGNVPIYNFQIKQIKGGDSAIQEFKFSVGVGEAVSKIISLDLEPETIIIFPRILGTVRGKTSNKAFTCLEQGKTIIITV